MTELTPDAPNDPLAPPWYWRFVYRVFDRRLPEEYGPWIVADLSRPGWPVRLAITKYLNALVVVALVSGVLRVTAGRWFPGLLWLGGFLLALLPYEVVRARRRPTAARKELLDRQGIDRNGTPLPADSGGALARIGNRVRERLLPRRDIEAMLYAVVMVLVLDGTAAIGFNMRPTDSAPPLKAVKAKGCMRAPGWALDAIRGTLATSDVTFSHSAAVRVKGGGLAVAVFVSPAPDPNTGSAAALFFVEDGRFGRRVRLSSFPATGVRARVQQIQITDIKTPRGAAALNATSCMGQTFQQK